MSFNLIGLKVTNTSVGTKPYGQRQWQLISLEMKGGSMYTPLWSHLAYLPM